MTLGDLVLLSLDNMWRRKLRATLSIAGVVIAIAALTALLSFGIGNQTYVEDMYRRFGLMNTMQVRPAEDSIDSLATPLDRNALALIAAVPGVELVFPYEAFAVRVTLDDTTFDSRARTLDSIARSSLIIKGALGEVHFRTDTAAEALVEARFLRDLGYDFPDSAVGRSIVLTTFAPSLDSALINVFGEGDQSFWRRLREIRFDSLFNIEYRRRVMSNELNESVRRFIEGFMTRTVERSDTLEIVGVADFGHDFHSAPIMLTEHSTRRLSSGPFGSGTDPVALITAMRQGQLFVDGDEPSAVSYPMVTVQFDPLADYQPIKDSIVALGFRAHSFAEDFDEIQEFFFYFNLGLLMLGMMALITAGLGIVNTLVMSISERRREIGIAKSLGFDERDITYLFLTESSLIGLIGSVVGVLVGWAGTRIASTIFKSIMESRGHPTLELFALPFWLVLLCLAFGVMISLAAGTYPAMRAARVDPVAALRGE